MESFFNNLMNNLWFWKDNTSDLSSSINDSNHVLSKDTNISNIIKKLIIYYIFNYDNFKYMFENNNIYEEHKNFNKLYNSIVNYIETIKQTNIIPDYNINNELPILIYNNYNNIVDELQNIIYYYEFFEQNKHNLIENIDDIICYMEYNTESTIYSVGGGPDNRYQTAIQQPTSFTRLQGMPSGRPQPPFVQTPGAIPPDMLLGRPQPPFVQTPDTIPPDMLLGRPQPPFVQTPDTIPPDMLLGRPQPPFVQTPGAIPPDMHPSSAMHIPDTRRQSGMYPSSEMHIPGIQGPSNIQRQLDMGISASNQRSNDLYLQNIDQQPQYLFDDHTIQNDNILDKINTMSYKKLGDNKIDCKKFNYRDIDSDDNCNQCTQILNEYKTFFKMIYDNYKDLNNNPIYNIYLNVYNNESNKLNNIPNNFNNIIILFNNIIDSNKINYDFSTNKFSIKNDQSIHINNRDFYNKIINLFLLSKKYNIIKFCKLIKYYIN